MPYHRDQAAREFARWSRSYDRSILRKLLFTPSHEALIARLRAEPGDRPWTLLDVGCGTGVFAARVRELFPKARVWGLDLCEAMLRVGRERWRALGDGFSPAQGDSERLPFADGSFDVVTCSNSFHHYPHQDRARRRDAEGPPAGRSAPADRRPSRTASGAGFIYDVCVAGVEGAVHHASAARLRDLFRRAGFVGTEQEVHRGLAPFLLTEGTTPAAEVAPAAHRAAGLARGSHR